MKKMANPLSKETREKIIKHNESGAKPQEIAKWLMISVSSVFQIKRLKKETGSIDHRPLNRGRKPKITEEEITKLVEEIKVNSDITLSEMIEKFSLKIKKSALSRHLINLGYSFKKKTTYPIERDRPDVVEKREDWQNLQPVLDIDKLVFLDESSVNLAYTRLYGRALKNERINEGVKDVRFQRKSILSTLRFNGETCPIVFDGTLDQHLFAHYVKTRLKPMLADDDILILDSCSVHKSKLVLKTFEECGINAVFLPPYSPDLNPIELFWAKFKTFLKKAKARTQKALYAAINKAFDWVSKSDVLGWFQHCGYSLQ
jgi:transposase